MDFYFEWVRLCGGGRHGLMGTMGYIDGWAVQRPGLRV